MRNALEPGWLTSTLRLRGLRCGAAFLFLSVFLHAAVALDWRHLPLAHPGAHTVPEAQGQPTVPTAPLLRSAPATELAPPPSGPAWTTLGPAPIPLGQTFGGVEVPVSGRISAIAVHPTNPSIVYVGAAQGGVYRSLDGGTTWTPLLDAAAKLSIGALAIDPQSASTLFVGTGEANLSGDSAAGVGIYIITNADGVSPALSGPFGAAAFNNRSISRIAINPGDHNTIFVTTTSGTVGNPGGSTGNFVAQPTRGLYRSQNALAATPSFTLLTTSSATNLSHTDVIINPANANVVICAAFGDGIYRSTNALDATPSFTRVVTLASGISCKLAIDSTGNTVLAATSELATKSGGGSYTDQGIVRKSTDGGATFPTTLSDAAGFAGGQSFYDMAIVIDQTNASNVYLAGTVSAAGVDPDGGPKDIIDDTFVAPAPSEASPSSPSTDPVNGTGPANGGGIFEYSNNGGTNFTPSVTGLHADSHAIAIAPSNSQVIYTGNDGGIWRSDDGGHTWTDLNTATFSATQFQSVAVHPIDRNFTIGGTQDNGTEMRMPDGTWRRADFGDGGYALIDQSATDTTNVTMYHTYFNRKNSLIGFGRVTSSTCADEGEWSFFGIYGGMVDTTVHCDGSTDTFNGIVISNNVSFYAPMALGPGTPNTLYFGTDRLYRSADRGATMSVVSTSPIDGTAVINCIGVSPQNDGIRIVGMSSGKVFLFAVATTQINGFPVLSSASVALPVGRTVIDPNDSTIAYVTLLGVGNASHVYKITGLGSTNTVTAISNGLPDQPVNAFVVDPHVSSQLYAGTEVGVYGSTDSGASWTPYGTGLPSVAVFDMAMQPRFGILRIATHGKGMWEIPAISQPPLMTQQPAPVTACAGDGVSFTATASGSPTPTVQWQVSTDGGTNFNNLSGQTNTTLSFTAAAADNNKLFHAVFSNTAGTVTSDPALLTVNPVPATPAITPNSGSVCGGSTGNQASSPAGATTYSWSITNGTITSATDGSSITYTAGVTGTNNDKVTLKLTVTNASGCAASNSADIAINPLPAVSITPTPSQVCAGSTGNQAAGPAGVAAYSWSANNGTITSATDIQTITYTAGASGTADLTLTVTDSNGCMSTTTAHVPINPSPAVPAITAPSIVQTGATGNSASGPDGATTYSWQINANGTLTSAADIQNVTFNAGTSGDIILTLTVGNSSGCTASNMATVHINRPPMAADDVAFAVNATALDIDVLANDSDPDLDPLTVTSVTQGQFGAVTIINSGAKVEYTPAGEVQPDSFSYTISDGRGGTDTAAVTIGDLFLSAAGIYNGLVQAPAGTTPSNDRSGLIRVKTDKKGVLSGSLKLAEDKFRFRGNIDATGMAHFGRSNTPELVLERKGQSELHLTLQLTLDPAIDQLTGKLTDGGNNFAEIDADRALYTSKKNPVLPLRPVPPEVLGKYTVFFKALTAPNNIYQSNQYPQGDGYGVLSVGKNGMAKLTGKLADGTMVGYSNALSKTNGWPFYFRLVKGKGSISGPASFRDEAMSNMDGLGLNWFNPGGKKRYLSGWPDGIQTDLLGSKLTKLPGGILPGLTDPDADGNAGVLLADGVAPFPALPVPINIDSKNKVQVIPQPGDQLELGLHIMASGVFSGKFVNPQDGKPATMHGVIFQKQQRGFGFFLGPAESEKVTIAPQ